MRSTVLLLSAILLTISLSCHTEIANEGYVNVEGGRIWYRQVGGGDGTPLLVLHGGPGGRSCDLIPGFSLLSDERPIIFYDQLGSGNSDRPTDLALWNVDRFVDEIDHLRRALHLDELHILGASCGSTFLIEYMVTRRPKGVRSVIFSSPMISTPTWIDDAKTLLAQLPESVQDTIKKYEAVQDYSAPEYLAATDEFYARYLTRKGWPPPETDECNGVPEFNEEIYNYMWGPTEFTSTGTLKSFDRTADLRTITQPILFIAGEYDEARPETMYKFQALCKNASVAIIDDAAHMTIIDQPEEVAEVIRRFLKDVEGE